MKAIRKICHGSVLEKRRGKRVSRKESERDSGARLADGLFFVNNVLLENSHTSLICVLSVAAFLV